MTYHELEPKSSLHHTICSTSWTITIPY